MPQSSIIVVGNEILRGFTVDTNSNWLAGRLFRCGYPVRLITTVGDVDEDIVAAIQAHVARTELSRIFVCGGLGPTPDDRTYVALARALDQPLVYRREVGAQMQNLMFLRNIAAQRGTAGLNAGNRRMAMLPQGAIEMGKKWWNKVTGITKAKRKFAKATGIPTTRSGRQAKAGRLGGCSIMIVILGASGTGLAGIDIRRIFAN